MPAPPFIPNARQSRALEAVTSAAETVTRLEADLEAARARLALRQERAEGLDCARVAIARATGISYERYRVSRKERAARGDAA